MYIFLSKEEKDGARPNWSIDEPLFFSSSPTKNPHSKLKTHKIIEELNSKI